MLVYGSFNPDRIPVYYRTGSSGSKTVRIHDESEPAASRPKWRNRVGYETTMGAALLKIVEEAPGPVNSSWIMAKAGIPDRGDSARSHAMITLTLLVKRNQIERTGTRGRYIYYKKGTNGSSGTAPTTGQVEDASVRTEA